MANNISRHLWGPKHFLAIANKYASPRYGVKIILDMANKKIYNRHPKNKKLAIANNF